MNRLIPCPICGQHFRFLGKHVKTHGLTALDFKKQHRYTSYVDILANRISELYITTRKKWVIHFRGGNIVTITNRSLSNDDIKQHLNGRNPISVHTAKGYSKWLIFDVDSSVGLYEAAMVTTLLISELENYFDTDDIHVSFSGNKGYHISLFFDRIIPNSELVAFAKHVTKFNQGNNEVNIEFRPESADGKAIKLPLGNHHKTGKFCSFVDKQYRPVKDQYDYLLDIKRIKPIDFRSFKQKEIADGVKPAKNPLDNSIEKGKIYDERNLAEVWENGLPQGGRQRNKYELPLAIWLKGKGYDRDTVKVMLYNFTEREYESKRTKDTASGCKSEINATVDKVFDRNLTLVNMLTKFEKELLSFFPRKVQATLLKIIRFAQSQDKQGFLYIAPRETGKMIGKSRRTIYRHIKELEDKVIFRVITGDHEQHHNSLYFCPIAKPIFGGTFSMPLENEHDFLLVLEYCWYRYRLSYLVSDELYYKTTIIREEELRQLPPKYQDYLPEAVKDMHVKYSRETIPNKTEVLLLLAGIHELELYLTGQKQLPIRFTDMLQVGSLFRSPVLMYLREKELREA
jgi:hypothetical protein